MTDYLIALRPVALGLTIGLIELFLSEALKISSKSASSWRRRTTLCKQTFYTVPRRNSTFLSKLLVAQLALLGLCIWLELTINPAIFPSSDLGNDRCFKTRRQTRSVDKQGPKDGELEDDRIAPYISEARCGNKLLSQALAGQTSLTRGYPPCEKDYELKNISESLTLQGGSTAHVANSGDGDPQLTYGLMASNGSIIDEDHGAEGASSLATTSFWSIHFGSYVGTTVFWRFGQPSERIISNVAIPTEMIDNAPTSESFSDESKGVSECTKNDLECYHNYAKIAKGLETKEASLVENKAGMFIRTHKSEGGNVPSYICIFDKGELQVDVSFVHMSQFIPGVERNRSGPTITQIKFTGNNAQCAWDVSRNTGRLYLDAMEGVALATMIDTHKSESMPMFETIRLILVKAAVILGMKTLETTDTSSACQVYHVTNGSSTGKTATIISGIYLAAIFICIIWEIITIQRNRWSCPMQVDPLETRELLEQLLTFQDCDQPRSGTTGSGVFQDETDKGEDTQSSNFFVRIFRKATNTFVRRVQTDNEMTKMNTQGIISRNSNKEEAYNLYLERTLHGYQLRVNRAV